jgi:hypothetical protein
LVAWAWPVSALFKLTVAWGMTAPLGSETTPVRSPEITDCEAAGMARRMANAKAKGSNNNRIDDITDFLTFYICPVFFRPCIGREVQALYV